jgi:hypothetical protein
MASPEIQYISDESGQTTAYLLKSDVTKRRLLEAKDRTEGFSIETVIEKLGI